MGTRGPIPRHKVKIKWSPNFAYAVGLITTDGNLSPDRRHINFTSKDLEQMNNFQKALGISYSIGRKSNGASIEKKYFVIQFSDVFFYSFLEQIGLHRNKSKTLGPVSIPSKYFFHFLRGCFDGDGTFYSYWDPRWRSSFMFYISFSSASEKFILWLRCEIKKLVKVSGHITKDSKKSTLQLKYAKREGLKILQKIYSSPLVLCLSRKRLKVITALGIVGKSL